MPDVAAVLVNYNAGHELRRALQSIADDMRGCSWEGVVVDNASADGSQTIAAEFAPVVRLIRNDSNTGSRPPTPDHCWASSTLAGP